MTSKFASFVYVLSFDHSRALRVTLAKTFFAVTSTVIKMARYVHFGLHHAKCKQKMAVF